MYEIERDAYTELNRKGPGCLYWLLWVGGNVTAFALGALVGDIVEGLLLQLGPETRPILAIEGRVEAAGAIGYPASIAGGLVAGTLLGITQSLVLRPYFKPRLARKWLFVTILGVTIRWLVIFLISQSLIGLVVDDNIAGPCVLYTLLALAGAIAGLAVGLPQSVLLAEKVHHPRWWVLANTAGPIATALLIGLSLSVARENVFRDYSIIVAGLIGGIVTGTTLIDLLKHPVPGAEWEHDLKWKRERKSKKQVEDTVLGSVHYGPPKPTIQNGGADKEDSDAGDKVR
jgi:hypothetical protein